jgi:inositol-phosphate phosphatase / L-galactose 1-phosphate phosphatase / histidinol-phosphatase
VSGGAARAMSKTTTPLEPFVALANRLADASGAIIRRHYRTKVKVDDKADASPVTIADRDAETAMRALISRELPTHGIIGEEHGAERPGADWVWVLDPVDGTKAFISGRPLFGTLIALCHAGAPVVGIIDCPALGERWVGTAGRPTLHQGVAAQTRPCPALSLATLSCTSPHMFSVADFARFERVRQRVKLPIYGGDCHSYGLVASGFVDVVIEAGLKVYDWAAIVPVIEGAGGVVTDWKGRKLAMDAAGDVIAAGDARAHSAAADLLSA